MWGGTNASEPVTFKYVTDILDEFQDNEAKARKRLVGLEIPDKVKAPIDESSNGLKNVYGEPADTWYDNPMIVTEVKKYPTPAKNTYSPYLYKYYVEVEQGQTPTQQNLPSEISALEFEGYSVSTLSAGHESFGIWPTKIRAGYSLYNPDDDVNYVLGAKLTRKYGTKIPDNLVSKGFYGVSNDSKYLCDAKSGYSSLCSKELNAYVHPIFIDSPAYFGAINNFDGVLIDSADSAWNLILLLAINRQSSLFYLDSIANIQGDVSVLNAAAKKAKLDGEQDTYWKNKKKRTSVDMVNKDSVDLISRTVPYRKFGDCTSNCSISDYVGLKFGNVTFDVDICRSFYYIERDKDVGDTSYAAWKYKFVRSYCNGGKNVYGLYGYTSLEGVPRIAPSCVIY